MNEIEDIRVDANALARIVDQSAALKNTTDVARDIQRRQNQKVRLAESAMRELCSSI